MGPKRNYETVDLTAEDEYKEPPRSQQRTQTVTNNGLAQTQRESWTESQENGEADDIVTSADGGETASFEFQLYGIMDTKIVGVQYYRGMANEGEYVIVRREPTNQYDANAIRVENVQMQQIGHIPRTVARTLASFMDDGSIKVEGCLSGRIGSYDCPIRLKLFGTSDPLERAELRGRMKSEKLPSQIIDQKEKDAKKRKAEELKKIAAAKKSKVVKSGSSQGQGQPWEQSSSQLGFTNQASSQGDGLSQSQSFDDIVDGAQSINPREMGEVVEKFGLDEEALASMPMADAPSKLATQLLPYQRQALQWLLEKEHPQLPASGSDDAVQLWKRSKMHIDSFTNIATNFSVKSSQLVLSCGGILSDDMGLGKTLEMIALMVSEKQKKGQCNATLIIAPVGVMSNWSRQISQHVAEKHALQVLTHHGPNKKTLIAEEINKYDVVITSYTTLAQDYMPKTGRDPPPVPRSRGFYSVTWRRVILDEGHSIRNPQTKAALAASALQAQSKWVLTGTPIINNLKDLYSLVRFIGLTGGLERLEIFNSILTRPVKAGDGNASLLLQALMASICLRRKKEMSFVDLRLPKISEYVHHVDFSDHEREKYDALQSEARGLLKDVTRNTRPADKKRPQDSYRHLLEILLRLRQVCNHWSLCGERVNSLLSQIESQKMVDLTPENKQALQEMLQLNIDTREDCPICLECLHNPVITRCAHSFGYECIERVIETQHRCPMCRAEPLDLETLVRPSVSGGESASSNAASSPGKDDASQASSKISALLSILRASHTKSKGTTKTVIFSQWTSFLTLIESHLPSDQKIARIDGTLTPAKRDAAMQAFSTDPDCTILLASLAVCSVGLNLVAANQVVLADSWWAPAIEDQAVDRVYRLGQKRDVTVWRLVVSGSVEERVLDVQSEKRELMGRAFRDVAGVNGGAQDGAAAGNTNVNGGRGRGRGVRTRLADIERLLG